MGGAIKAPYSTSNHRVRRHAGHLDSPKRSPRRHILHRVRRRSARLRCSAALARHSEDRADAGWRRASGLRFRFRFRFRFQLQLRLRSGSGEIAHTLASDARLGPGAQIASLPGVPPRPPYHPPGVQARASVVFIRAGTQPASLRCALTRPPGAQRCERPVGLLSPHRCAVTRPPGAQRRERPVGL
jgi:hypothetical protein